MPDPNVLAHQFALLVKEAVVPVLEKVSALDAKLAGALATVESLQRENTALRERVAVAEQKRAIEMPDVEPVDLAPLAERQSATDARLATAATSVADLQRDVVSLRERLAIAETKGVQAIPDPAPPTDLGPVFERLAVTETKLGALASLEAGLNTLRERLTVAETKADRPLDLPTPVDVAPFLERLAVAETKAAAVPGLETAIQSLRERLTVAETKTNREPEPPPAVDLGPVLERIAIVETKASDATGVKDDITAIRQELALLAAKAAPSVDLTPLCERIAGAEARLDTLGDLRDRVVVIETKSAQPAGPIVDELHVHQTRELFDALKKKGEPDTELRDRVLTLERKGESTAQDLSTVRERIVALETRAPVPGPAGLNGKDGKDGVNGKDGLGFEDLSVGFDGDRTIQLSFVRESQRKDFPIVLPYLRYQGVFTEGKAYQAGDVTTWGGAMWHANEPTTAKPGNGSKAWTLAVKPGRDGKDGRDAQTLPVVGLK